MINKTRVVLALLLECGVLAWGEGSVHAQSGIFSGIDVSTSTTTSLVDNGASYNDRRSAIYASGTNGVVVATPTGGTLTVTTNYSNAGGDMDNHGTTLYAENAGKITINGNLDFTTKSDNNTYANTYADVTATGANSVINVTGKVTASTDSRLSPFYASSGGTINLGSVDLTTVTSADNTSGWYGARNNQSYAILANDSGSVNVAGEFKVTSSQSGSHGIEAWAGSNIHLGSYDANVQLEGIVAMENTLVYPATKATSSIIIDNNAKVEVVSSSAVSVTGSRLNIGGDADIKVTGTEIGSAGIKAQGGSVKSEVTIAGKAVIDIAGATAGHGIYANNANVTLGSTDITTAGNSGYGIHASTGGTINVINGDTVIKTTGASGDGIRVDHGKVELQEVNITTTGASAAGMRVWRTDGSLTANNITVNTYGTSAPGIKVEVGGTVEANKVTIKTSNESNFYNYGIWTKDANSSLTVGDIDITTAGRVSNGILAATNSKIDGKNLTVLATGWSSSGVKTETGAKATFSSADITLNGKYGYSGYYVAGLWANGSDSEIIVDNAVKVKTTGTYTKGLWAEAGSHIKTGDIDIDIQDANTWSFGVQANNSKIETGNALIKNAGKVASGILVENNSQVTMGDVDVTMNGGTGSYGIQASSTGTTLSVGDAKIKTEAADSYGTSIWGGAIANFKSVDSTILGNNSYGFITSGTAITTVAGDTKIVTSGNNSEGVEVWGGGKFTTDTIDITTNGSDSLALRNFDNSEITVTTGGNIVADGTNSSALRTEGRYAGQTPTINLTGVTVTAPTSHLAISGKGTGKINLVNSTVTGDVKQDLYTFDDGTSFNGDLAVNMTNTKLTGATHALTTTSNLNMSMDSTSLWNVTANSDLNNFKNVGGTVDMVTPTSGAYETIEINHLAGTNGNYLMNSDLGSQTDGDKMIVHSSEVGAGGTVQVYDKSLVTSNMVVGEKKLLMIVDDNKTTQFTGARLHTGGLWDVDPTFERIGNDWYLVKVVKVQNTSTETILGDLEAGYGLWRGALTDDTLRKRLGDLRYNETEEGTWARIKAGKLIGPGFDNSYQMYQVGYDRRKDNNAYGIAIEHTRNRSSLTAGSGEDTMTGLALYATNYRSRDKFQAYSDIVLRADRLRGDMHSYGDIPDRLEYGTWAYSASYEYGKTYSDKEDKGYFIEPQGQLTYGYMRGGDYATDYGVKVKRAGMHSLVGRLGVVLGRRIHETDGKKDKSDYYLKANMYREFAGNGGIYLTTVNSYGDTEHVSHAGEHKNTWYELGLGGNVRINPKTHVYGDVLKSFGGPINAKWQVNAGVRWEF